MGMKPKRWFKAKHIPILQKWLKKRCAECLKSYPHYFCEEHRQAMEREIDGKDHYRGSVLGD